MRTTVIGLFVVGLVGFAGPIWAGPPESTDDTARAVNEVSDLGVQHREDGTYLRLQSTQTPSFSVFKLRAPLRLVVDISNSKLQGDKGPERVDNGTISQVSLLESEQNGQSRVRLIVGFERAAHYDVRTDGNDVVIFVEGGDTTSGSGKTLEANRERLREVRSKFKRARSKLNQTRSELRNVRNELSSARQRAKQLRRKVGEASGAAKERLQSKLEAKNEELENLESKLATKSSSAESLRTKLEDLEGEKEAAEARVAQLEQKLGEQKEKARRRAKKLEQLRAKRDKWTDAVDELEEKLSHAESEIAQLREARERAKGEARARYREKLQEKAETLEKIKVKLQDRRTTVSTLREQVRKLEAERDRARRKVASIQKQWRQRLHKSQSKYSAAREKLNKARMRLERAQREMAALKAKKENTTGEVRERVESKLARKSEELKQKKRELARRKKTAQNLRSQVEKLRREKSKKADRLAAQRERLEETRRRMQDVKGELQTYRSRLDDKDETIEELESRIANLEESSDDSSAAGRQLERLRAKLEKQKSQVDALQRARKRQEQLLTELRETKQKAGEKVDRYQQRLDNRDQKIASLKSRVETLRKRARENKGDAKARQAKLERLERRLERHKQKLAALRDRQDSDREDAGEPAREQSGPGGDKRAARAVPVDGSKAEKGDSNTIRDIRLETNGGESRIVVELERPGEYKRLPWKESRAVMLLNNVELPDRLEQTIESSGESGAVQFVSSFEASEGRVRMEAELGEKGAEEQIRQEGNKLVWKFAPDVAEQSPGKTRPSRGEPDRPQQGTSYTAAPPNYPRTVVDPSKVRRVPGMSRKQVTLDLHQADIHNVLRWFSKEGGINIITGEDVSGSSTISLERVPLDQAFLIVLQSNGLGFQVRDDVIRVAPQKKLRQEQKKREEARQRQQKTRPLEVFLMPINYAEADDMVEQVKRLLSPRGSVSVDERTNTLVIKDLPANIRSIRQLVGALDAQVPQVLIEARIVETNDTFSQEFGIQWGGDFTMAQGSGNPTGLAFPNVLGVAGGATDSQAPTQGTASNPNFAVNLPAPAGTGSGGALGLTMGSVSGSVNLNLRLSAAEESGRAKIISAPKILTLDNREATISQGTSIPISVVSAAGVQTVFVDATLELTVTPHVTPDGNVQLEISATKNEPDFQNTGARGDPTIIRKQAETELLIADGETTVIGGIYTRNTGRSVTGVPLLHQIPILGMLFKKTSRSERRSELLIFITPRVVNRAEALGDMSAGNVVEGVGSNAGGGGRGGQGGGGR